jgi:hypothetical protein
LSDQTSTLLIRLLSTGDLTALARGKDQTEAMKVSVDGLKRALEGLGVGLTFAAALEGVKSAVEFGSALNDLSIQAGISTQAFQTLAYVSDAAGVKQEELGASLNILNRNLAEAATGAGKQNKAIADLGLNTAELLAMPVEKQIEAIARAYVNASDKGRAWADVVALLGKNSAKLREIFQELGTKGLAALDAENPIKISDSDIAKLDKVGDFWSKLYREMKTVGASAVARPGDAIAALLSAQSNPAALSMFMTKGMVPEKGALPDAPAETEAEKQAKIEAIKAQLEATIQAMPQMVTAHRALEKALQDERKAYEGPAEAARRLREEAQADMDQADKLSADKYDAVAQLEAVKLRIEAAKLRSAANAEDAKAMRDQDKFIADQVEMNSKFEQMSVSRLAIADQITKAHQHEASIFTQLEALDKKSLTYRQDKLKLEGQLLAVKQQIAALDEKSAAEVIERDIKEEEMKSKRSSIAMAGVDHDFTKTDAEKWELKKQLLTNLAAEQEKYVRNMRAMENTPGLPQGARDKARDAANSGTSSLMSTREQLAGMGPDPHSFIENFSAGITSLKNQWGTLQQNMAHGLTGVISTGLNSVSSNVTRLITGFQGLGQTIRSIAVDIGVTLVQAFVDMGVKWVAQKLMMAAFDKSIAAASVAALVPIALAQSAVWATPATLATIASFGGAALAAPEEMAIAIAAGNGLALASEGGYFPGDPAKPRGIFHGDEFVWSAPAVRAIGAGNLERAHQAALSGGGGVSAGGGAPGTPGNIILAMSPEDVARSQRKHVDARVIRMAGKIPMGRVAL